MRRHVTAKRAMSELRKLTVSPATTDSAAPREGYPIYSTVDIVNEMFSTLPCWHMHSRTNWRSPNRSMN